MQHSLLQKSISFLLVALIAIFALSSFGNVREYIANFHPGWTSWALGVGFSLTVFVCAYIAATAKDPSTRRWSIVVGIVFGFASGMFQYQLYRNGEADEATAFLLSFIPIVVGEVGLALVESSYSRERANRQPEIDPAEFDAMRLQIEAVKQESADHQKRVEQLSANLESAKQESDKSKTLAESRLTELENAQRSLENLQQQHDRLGKAFDEFSTDSVLGRLSDAQRQKMDELFQLVSEQRITGPGDLFRAGMPKSDAYALWPVATASQLVYLNGDGAYHVRG